MILDYLRTGSIEVDTLHEDEVTALRQEADYYQVPSLLRVLHPPKFERRHQGKVKFSQLGSVARNDVAGVQSCVLSDKGFSGNDAGMSVCILEGGSMFVGVAAYDILWSTDEDVELSTEGWHVWIFDGFLFGEDGVPDFNLSFDVGDVITVKVDERSRVSFSLNGVDKGVAFNLPQRWLPRDLCLSVVFDFDTEDKRYIVPGAVQLV